MERSGFLSLQHAFDTVRDAWFEDNILVIRQITFNPNNGLEAAIKLFRLTEAECLKIADLIVTLEQSRQHTRVATAGEST